MYYGIEHSERIDALDAWDQSDVSKINPRPHLAPPRADYEQAFTGANFNTEIVSGAPLRSPEHIF